ncbi:MAG TPA: CYTH domain-containing protein [Devosia sp.]|nr:CYTH domain-containing protein [Devosia sp.]
MNPGKAHREIERKFLVVADGWRRRVAHKSHIEQGYLARGRRSTIRVRIKDGKAATLTIKSREPGISRSEFEYRIALKDAKLLLELCGALRIEKHRFEVPQGRLTWEIDVFSGRHDGLVVAEIELPREDYPVRLPVWIGEDVTDDLRYRNSSLVGEG